MRGVQPVSMTSFVRRPEELEFILSVRRGELRDTPYRVLLLAIGMSGKPAVLRLRRNQLSKDVIFEDGVVIDCQSNIATETIGRFLVSTGKLSEEQYRTAMQGSVSRGVHIEELLTAEKLLTPTELYRAMQQNLGRKLLEPFSWTSGTWQISYDVPPAESALRVRVPQLVLTGVMKVEPQEVVDQAMDGIGELVAAPGDRPLFAADELRLGEDHRRVLEAARLRVPLRDLASRTNLQQDDAARAVCALALLGVLRFEEPGAAPAFELDLPPEPVRTAAPHAAVAAPPVAEAGEVRAGGRPEVASEEDVIAAYLSFRRKDAFALLGVAADAPPHDIARAYVAFAGRFLPAHFSEHAPDGLREKAQEVFLAGARAYAELADPLRREALLQQREARSSGAMASAHPAALGESTESRRALIDPEALWREGRSLAAKGKLREALSNFELAADCDVQNANYAAEVAWCRFQLMISPAPQALKSLKNAIRLDGRCALAYLYAGRVMKTMGNELEAQAYLDRANRLMPARRP